MKVILMQDVTNLGEVGEVVEVAGGYGRNYLVPQGLAIAATARNKRQLEHQQRLREQQIAKARKAAAGLAEQLRGVTCSFTRKSAEEGRLFGSVTSMDIVEQLKASGIELDRRRVQLDQPIRSVGQHSVPVRLPGDLTAEVKVTVVAEATEPGDTEAAASEA
jgi:large subunit ribosomal protein L9